MMMTNNQTNLHLLMVRPRVNGLEGHKEQPAFSSMRMLLYGTLCFPHGSRNPETLQNDNNKSLACNLF